MAETALRSLAMSSIILGPGADRTIRTINHQLFRSLASSTFCPVSVPRASHSGLPFQRFHPYAVFCSYALRGNCFAERFVNVWIFRHSQFCQIDLIFRRTKIFRIENGATISASAVVYGCTPENGWWKDELDDCAVSAVWYCTFRVTYRLWLIAKCISQGREKSAE